MQRITINGKTVEIPDGASFSINGNNVTINGNGISSLEEKNIITIEGGTGDVNIVNCDNTKLTINGDVSGSVKSSGSVTAGNIGQYLDAGGSVECGTVNGDVKADGSATINGDVAGSARAGGSLRCGKVSGDVKAGGSVRHS